MKHASAIIVIFSMMLPWHIGVARESLGKTGPLTLRDCLLYARTHAHANRISRLETEAACADRRIGVSDLMPYIGVGSNGSMSFGRNIDPETNTYDNKKTLGTGFGLEMSIPLFDGLVRINNLNALKAAQLRKKKEEEVEQDRISLEVIKGFYNIAYCRDMTEQIASRLERDSTDLAGVRRSLSLGMKSGADVAELEAIVAADRYELVNQQNLLKKAYLDLRTSMGMPVSDSPLLLTTDEEYRVDTQGARELPEIEEARLAVREQRMNLRSAKGGYSPRINFNAGVSTSYYRLIGTSVRFPSFSRQFRDNMGEYFSFSFSLPIFDGLATANRVKKASVKLRESEVRYEQTMYQIDKITVEARLDLQAAIEELAAANSRLDAERIAYNAVRRKYELGAASAIELYTSSTKLTQAVANLTGKRIQKIIAEITLHYYQGYPLIR